MTDRRLRAGRRRFTVDIDRDLADRLDVYSVEQGVGREVYVEAAVAEYLARRQRDRDNPRVDSIAEE